MQLASVLLGRPPLRASLELVSICENVIGWGVIGGAGCGGVGTMCPEGRTVMSSSTDAYWNAK